MADFMADLQDIKFVLFDLLEIQGSVLGTKQFADFERDDIEMVVEEAYRFAKEEFGPANEPGDREGCTVVDGAVQTPKAYHKPFKTFCENGWMSVNASPEWGGGGMPNIVNSAVIDLMFGANPALALAAILTPGAARLIEAFGSDELKKTYLTKMYSGEWGGTMCLTEAQAGSDVGAASTKAIPVEGTDTYKIQGDKIFITYGDTDMVPNVIHLVLARVEGSPKGTKGLSLFCVPKYLPTADGKVGEYNDVQCTAIEHKMGINGSPTCQMTFGADENCVGWLVGEEGRGMPEMFQLMNEARINVGIQGAAAANEAYLHALDYSRERVQGLPFKARKDPTASKTILNHPDVAMMLTRQKAYAEGLRALCYFASYCEDMHQLTEGDDAARWQALADIFTPIAKAYASDMGFRVTEWAIQCYGGYGFLKDYPAEQSMRDVKIASIYEGTNGIQALDMVGRKLSAKGGFNVKALDALFAELCEANKEHPYFQREIAALSAARDTWGKVTHGLADAAGRKDMDALFLGATNYLSLCGDLSTAYFLLHSGVKAYDKLGAIAADKGFELGDEGALIAAAQENADVRHLHGKLKIAQFFVAHELPNMHAKAASVLSGDRAALSIVWEAND
jgi:alkylation response protein AidB-like acyl-CoA dehydrogenase